jgi:hypothetical protein
MSTAMLLYNNVNDISKIKIHNLMYLSYNF